MYSEAFCKVYNEFGWNYFPEAFGQQLLQYLRQQGLQIRDSLDLACGTGVLCRILAQAGIRAEGLDLSPGMIDIARKSGGAGYRVGDMTRFCRPGAFDLVTCTGDAVNHLLEPEAVEAMFANVFASLRPGGRFVFDLLDEKEISAEEPFRLDFSESVNASFCMRREGELVKLCTTVTEAGKEPFTQVITERIHPRQSICRMLEQAGFRLLRCAHRLLDDGGPPATTWFVIALRPE